MGKLVHVALGILTHRSHAAAMVDGQPRDDWHPQAPAGQGQLRILITRRPANTVYGGYWELPGGKVDPDETPQDAMVRELKEELGIQVQPTQPLNTVSHIYPHAHVLLHPFLCHWLAGPIQHLAVEEHRWVLPGELKNFPFPEANLPIIVQLLDYLSAQDTQSAADCPSRQSQKTGNCGYLIPSPDRAAARG